MALVLFLTRRFRPIRRRPVRRMAELARRTRDVMSASAEAGMTTAEYAVGTLAACAFAGVLWAVVRSSAVHSLVQSVIERALNLAP